jgi:hypothetical protein
MAFLGISNFKWFIGVVEDRQDPLKVGRLKVRCLGIHTSDKNKIPTADLPWASVALPVTSSGISGIGHSATGIVEGSWVWGYFRDGEYLMQELVVVGTLPGKPSELGNPNAGFYDPNRRSTDEDEDDYNLSVYPRNIAEPDTNRLAVNNPDKEAASLTARKASRITGVPTADFDAVGDNITASDTDIWNQPEIAYNAVYPYNHVTETESGHILEFDDTSAAERIYLAHKTGTSTEYNPNGDLINIIKGTSYTLTSADNKVNIDGLSDITIGGRHKIYINKNGQTNNHYDIQIGPNANINIQVDQGDINLVTKQGKINMNAGGDYNLKVKGNYTLEVEGNMLENVTGANSTRTSNTSGAVIHRGRTIDLNP